MNIFCFVEFPISSNVYFQMFVKKKELDAIIKTVFAPKYETSSDKSGSIEPKKGKGAK